MDQQKIVKQMLKCNFFKKNSSSGGWGGSTVIPPSQFIFLIIIGNIPTLNPLLLDVSNTSAPISTWKQQNKDSLIIRYSKSCLILRKVAHQTGAYPSLLNMNLNFEILGSQILLQRYVLWKFRTIFVKLVWILITTAKKKINATNGPASQ